MKISVWCPYYPPHTGGLETYAEELHRELGHRMHAITVFTPDLPPGKTGRHDPNVNIIRYPAFDLVYNFPFPKLWHPVWWKKLKAFIKTDADVLISYTRFFLSSLFALLHSRLKKIPWMHIEHGSAHVTSQQFLISFFSHLVDYTWGRAVFRFSSVNVAPSKSARNFIAKFDTRKVPVIYRGLDYQKIAAIKPLAAIREKFPDQVIITYAGRLISGKNISGLIEAFSNLSLPNTVLYIAGTGDAAPALKREAQKSPASSRIHFLGPLSWEGTIGLIKASDIIVNPSFNEGLPTLVLEAAACQKAILASNVGGTPEIVTNNLSGLLFNARKPDDLSQAIEKLASTPHLRSVLGRQARRQVENKFNWPNAAQSYVQLLSSLS